MRCTIDIEKMEFFAYHGCFEAEQRVGNKFLVNLSVIYNCDKAAHSDRVEDALNYQELYSIISDEMAIRSHILENLASRIIDALMTHFPKIESIKIKVSKLNPPIGGKIFATSVTLEK